MLLLITGLLIILSLAILCFTKRTIRIILCSTIILFSIIGLFVFIHLINISGGPDRGNEFFRFILPAVFYLSFLAFGLIYLKRTL